VFVCSHAQNLQMDWFNLMMLVVVGAGFAMLFHQFALSLAIAAAPLWLMLVVYQVCQRSQQVD